MEREMGKELNQMCNLSDYVEEIGIKKGIEQGMEKHLTEQIMNKIAKGKTIPEIADALAEDEETIRRLVESLSRSAV